MTFGRRQCDPINGCGSLYPTTNALCPSCGASHAFSSFIPYNPLDWVYDLECYPNIFTAAFKHPNTGARMFFEISEWRNDLSELIEFLYALKTMNCRAIGFNNLGYDYPILHFIMENYHLGLTYHDIYAKNESIINTPWDQRFNNLVWESDTHIIQIDLYKIHHFDNDARRTSLKMIEYNLRMDSIQDLPFEPGVALTYDESRELIIYNWHDVDATMLFYFETLLMIEFREQLGEKYNKNFLNHNDKKIGTAIFVHELEKAVPGSTSHQTRRESINLADVIFPYIKLDPEFERVRQWLASQTIVKGCNEKKINLKGIFKDINCTIDGFKYVFGSGGIHGSIDSTIVESDDEFIIYDWDVAGFYPELGSVNGLYPEHLSDEFCVINKQLAVQRSKYKKGTALNNAIKLARNGAYGDSNNEYSPFYDPQYTMSITINGQLLLCMLAQYLIKLPGLSMVQINTDGLTVKCPRDQVEQMKAVCKWWEDYTQLELESAVYSRMFIRDVNNYIAEYEDGKLKAKGCYVYQTKLSQGLKWTPADMDWHQNQSALLIPMAAQAALVHGQCIRDFIINHPDIMDFMLRTKVGRADQLVLSTKRDEHGCTAHKFLQRITRYYIAKQGGSLIKISPPAKGVQPGVWKRANSLTDEFYNGVIAELKTRDYEIEWRDGDLDAQGLPWDGRINTKNRSKYEIRNTSINAGWLVSPCNDIKQFNRDNINFEYYIKEAEKLVEPLR